MSRGKPQDVVDCYKSRPKKWGEGRRKSYNPHLPDRISTAGFTRSLGEIVEIYM
jgi:hypothetical protein